MINDGNFCALPIWYQALAPYTFETKFVKLRTDAISALADSANCGAEIDMDSAVSKQVIEDLRPVMKQFPGNCFVSVDLCAPTDTERFAAKRGAVFSPESAWYYLAHSAKVAASAAAGKVEFVCIRPYRNMSRAREFRLFIHEGKLSAMSQYNLIRHFRRLEGVRNRYWRIADAFVQDIIWRLPEKTLVMDIYLTSSEKILIIDINPWGKKTDPLLLKTWERDWNEVSGIHLIPPPTAISGEVKVSF